MPRRDGGLDFPEGRTSDRPRVKAATQISSPCSIVNMLDTYRTKIRSGHGSTYEQVNDRRLLYCPVL